MTVLTSIMFITAVINISLGALQLLFSQYDKAACALIVGFGIGIQAHILRMEATK